MGTTGLFWAQYAFAHHETGHMGALPGGRSLVLRPTNASLLTLSPMCSSRLATRQTVGNFWRPGSRVLTRVRPTTSISPGIRHCLSWREAITSGRLLYETAIRPAVIANSAPALNDSAALLWRMSMYSGATPPFPPEEVRPGCPGGVETRSSLPGCPCCPGLRCCRR